MKNIIIYNNYIEFNNIFENIKNLINDDLLHFISNSYKFFLQSNKFKFNLGIKKIINKIFPIYIKNFNILINYVNFYIFYPSKSENECILNGLNYNLNLKLRLSLINFDDNHKIIEDLYFLDIPFITENKTFIIGGIEKTTVSKLVVNQGLYFFNKLKKHKNFKYLKLALDNLDLLFYIIDNKLVLNYKNNLYSIIDILIYLGSSKYELINNFYNYEYIYQHKGIFKLKICKKTFLNMNFPFNLIFNNSVLLDKYKFITNFYDFDKNKINYIIINKSYIINKFLGQDLFFNGRKIANANDILNYDLIKKLIKLDVKFFKLINISSNNHNIISLNLFNKERFIVHLKKINQFNLDFIKKKFILNKFFISDLNFKLNFNNKIFKFKNNFLSIENIIEILKILITFNDNIIGEEDFQNLKNLKVQLIGDILEDIIYNDFFLIKKKLLNSFYFKFIKISNLINFNNINKKIENFFNLSEYCQFLDQTNFLSELTHKRKISLFSVRGISRKYSGYNVRDSNLSYYNKICPVETPEGINIGLVNYLAILSFIDLDNNIISVYHKFKNNKIKKKFYFLKSEEEKYLIISDYISNLINNNNINVRYNNQLLSVKKKFLEYKDIMPGQFLSVSALLVPFIEHNDSNRALMASNMLKQSLPVLIPEKPLIGTGIEKLLISNKNNKFKFKFMVKYLDNKFFILKKFINIKKKILFKNKILFLNKYIPSNQNTNNSQINKYFYGDNVFPSENIFDNSNSNSDNLSLGKNVNVAFMSWFGYNFEDSIIVSEKILHKNSFTNLNIYSFDIPIYFFNKLEDEEIIFNNNNTNLDEFGIIKLGSNVSKGDILINKIKKNKFNNILNNIIPDKDKVNNDLITLNENINNGVVVDVKVYFSKNFELDQNDKKIKKSQILNDFKLNRLNFDFFVKEIYFKFKNNINFILRKKSYSKIDNLKVKKKLNFFFKIYFNLKNNIKNKYYKNLYFNIKKIIKIKIMVKRFLQVGDKMSGRHGNKGVISKILPENEMPYMKNGWKVDIILNPLGVTSRMNIGQLLEIHLGLAGLGISLKIKNLLKDFNIKKLRSFIKKLYRNKDLNFLNDKQIINLSKFLSFGVPFGILPFNNFKDKDIKYFLDLAFETSNLDLSLNKKQIYMYDGLTGKKFDNPITFGVMYMLKLNHLVENKIHSRSTGPYSLITQQPLKGKSKLGGQRLGEMEVWALQAYGAAYSLQEMLTIKSDDVKGRFEIYKNIIDGNYKFFCNKPNSFDVMINNINSLGIYIKIYDN